MQSYHRVHVQLQRKDRQKIASMLSKGQESARVLRRASILRLLDSGQKAVQVAAKHTQHTWKYGDNKMSKPPVEMIGDAPDVDDDSLSAKRSAFCREYCVDHNARQAAIRAGYSEATAQEQGSRLLSNVKVRAAIKRRLAAIADAAEVDSALVISELYQVAMADPRELMRVEVDSCRSCHSLDHKYHWQESEYKRALNTALSAGKPAPDIEGGFGYDPRRDPHPDCPDCFGRGVDRVTVTPSHKLSRGAAKLLASVRQTKDGIEIKSHDKMAALIALGRVVGVFKDRQELSGPGGVPIQLQPVQPLAQLNPEQLEAIIRASGHPALQGHPADKPLTPHQIEAITGGSK